ncbi:tRNA(Ile)-lysidine synthase [uncultured archaeon]|nr:tRNA(Ile)-lysidine synthase [uncultured archaeon]
MSEKYQVCKRCIMDTTDPDIVFDENGYCNHCTGAIAKLNSYPLNLHKGEKDRELEKIVKKIQKTGIKKKYDCVVGVSGGADSSYTLYLVKKLGLRPLAVHVDNGWNSELSVINIEKLISKLEVDLHTFVLDWDEFKDLQLSFLKSSTPDLEIPTDHALIAALYYVASKYNIKYIISGHNLITESIAVPKWSHGHYDWRYIKNIQKKFGTKKLKKFPNLSLFKILYEQVLRGITMIRILNYVSDYDKKEIVEFLGKEFGWKNYPTKHGESVYTYFIQSYILPKKFNYDKRKMHLSNLICAGQITREDALKKLQENLFTDNELKEMINYVCDKLDITTKEFDALMILPNKSYYDYPSYETHIFLKVLRNIFKKWKPMQT